MLNFFLKNKFVRDKINFYLSQNYYNELDFQIPLSHGLICPVYKKMI